jgi:SEC-C motif-containing protein
VQCPCGLPASFEDCCGRFVGGHALPSTAEQLMRSRYTAFATGAIDYLMETHDPRTVDTADPERLTRWSKSSTWLGLRVMTVEGGSADHEHGTVAFAARFFDGKNHEHRERSAFRKHDGRWFYVGGSPLDDEGTRQSEKVARNSPCSCGSGKKYKRCCGRPGVVSDD